MCLDAGAPCLRINGQTTAETQPVQQKESGDFAPTPDLNPSGSGPRTGEAPQAGIISRCLPAPNRAPPVRHYPSMRRLLRFLHHRSLSASLVSLFFGFLALGFLPEHTYRLRQQGMGYLTSAAVATILSLAVCSITLFILIRDNRSGYPAFRCSLATLFWALGCAPVIWLILVLVGEL